MGRTGDELEALIRELGIKLAVGVGSTVTVRDLADGKLRDYTFTRDVGDTKSGHASMGSALAAALVGARSLGEEVTARLPDGDRRLVVSRIHVHGSKRARQLAAWSLVESQSSSPPPASAGAGEPPWVFVADAKKVLRQVRSRPGRRSVVVDQPWALVAASSKMEVETVDGGGPAVVDTLRQGTRRLYRASGKVGFRAEDGALTVVETGRSAGGADFKYKLHGERRVFGRAGTPVFLGRPALRKWQGDILQGVVPEQELEWLPDVPGATWGPAHPPEAVVGLGLLRCTRAGVVRRSVQVCVLPATADLEVRPSSDARRGEIALTGFGEIEATVAEPSGVEAKGSGDDRDYCLVLAAHAQADTPPRSVVVTVQWRGRDGSLGRAELKLPFPSEHAAFFDSRGREFAPGFVLTARQLAGARAEAVVLGDAKVELRAEYAGRDEGEIERRCSRIARDVPTASRGHRALDLASVQPPVQDALAVGRDLDGAVKLLIRDGREAGPSSSPAVMVKRFDLALEHPDPDSRVLRLDTPSRRNAAARDLASLSVEALPLLDPALKPVTLRRADGHSWDVSLTPGPYLVVGRQGDWQRIRPLVWLVGPTRHGSESAHPASETARPRPATAQEAYARGLHGEEAVELFHSVTARMSQQPGSSDWRLAFGYLQKTSLPVHCFPLLQAMARVPKACAMAAVVAENDDFDLLWERMEALSCAWWQVPLCCWRDAFGAHAKHRWEAISVFGDTDLARQAFQDDIRSRIDRVKARLDGADEAFASIRTELTGD